MMSGMRKAGEWGPGNSLGCAIGWVVAWLVCLGCVANAADRAAPSEGKEGGKAVIGAAFERGALAAQLALEGERRGSPVLLLAAAEVLAGLKESARDTRDVRVAGEAGAKPVGGAKLSPTGLIDRARELAKGDEALKAVVEKAAERFASRGLAAEQGQKMANFETDAGTFKLVDRDVIQPKEMKMYENVIFEAGKVAAVAVIGTGAGDLDLLVHDGGTGALVGKDDDATSRCLVQWIPAREGPFTIKVGNAGGAAEEYLLIVNW